MEHLHHNGVLVPPRYRGKGLTIKVRGNKIELAPEQEEMVRAWVQKVGSPYVEDRVFTKNFHRDLSKKLKVKVKPGEIDYSDILFFVKKASRSKKIQPQTQSKA